MGDRVLMQVVRKKRNEFGPVLYAHWSGYKAHEIVAAFKKRMNYTDDTEYASARLVQCAMGTNDESTGFGIWNVDRVLTKDDTHGDAGIVLIYCDDDFRCECMGGYLKTDGNGNIVPPA